MQASTYLESASLQKHQQLQGYNKKLFETASFIVHRKLGLIYMSIVFQHSIRIWDLYMWLFSVAKRKFCVYVWLPCVYLRPSSNVCENMCVCVWGGRGGFCLNTWGSVWSVQWSIENTWAKSKSILRYLKQVFGSCSHISHAGITIYMSSQLHFALVISIYRTWHTSSSISWVATKQAIGFACSGSWRFEILFVIKKIMFGLIQS